MQKLHWQHLDALLNQVIAANHWKRMNVLKYLIQAEHNWQCYTHFWQHTKPKSLGGLTFMTQMEYTNPSLTKKNSNLCSLNIAEPTLLKQKGHHLPLLCWATYYIMMPSPRMATSSPMVINGHLVTIIYNYDEPMKAILANLKCKTPNTSAPSVTLNYSTLLQGFKKWLERTTMSLGFIIPWANI